MTTNDAWPWPNFSRREIACPHCGRLDLVPAALDALQRLRTGLGRPLRITSAYRCPAHNALVGGAPLSRHKLGDAFDISTAGMSDPEMIALYRGAVAAGFTGFGLAFSFLHVDCGRPRRWGYSPQGDRKWTGLGI